MSPILSREGITHKMHTLTVNLAYLSLAYIGFSRMPDKSTINEPYIHIYFNINNVTQINDNFRNVCLVPICQRQCIFVKYLLI